MRRIIFATGNEGKMKEIRAILADLGVPVLSMKEAGITAEIVEDGKTFEENADIKARTIMELTGDVVLADDSGLEIDWLNGEPGIYSARYMGEDTSYDIKNSHLIQLLDGVPQEQRTARFVCVISAAFPDGRILHGRGTIEGMIGYEIKGENGFGYDPIFYLPEYGCTTAELPPEKKNELSHRGKALREIKMKLRDTADKGEGKNESFDSERHTSQR
ncbi:MAG: XTP/dITP diphosphatase [Lachnospiraceae bacterium]|jgi:XTP/dITP diphosphohydrolase|nr:XTP/dITP diphosphatase [Lachnospiraceae bacterium]MCI9660908.1 XTP/dITP diphosphatase [Lachnospiraceae bacterium]